MREVSNKQKSSILYLVSIIAAVIIWVFITYSENPQIDITVNTVNINFTGENLLLKNDLMIINKAEIPPAQLVLRGKRRDLMNVLGNITANVDVSSLSSKGTYKFTPTFDIPSNAVFISKRITNYIEFEVVPIEEKTVDVKILTLNSDKNTSQIVETIPEITTITLKGSKKDIDLVDHATITVDVATMTEDNSKDYEITYENAENLPVIFTNEVFSEQDTINVENKVYEKKTLPISFMVPSSVVNGYVIKVLNAEANSVVVGLKNKKAREITSISNINNFDNVTKDTTTHTAILDVPKNIYIPKENQEVTLTVEVIAKD